MSGALMKLVSYEPLYHTIPSLYAYKAIVDNVDIDFAIEKRDYIDNSTKELICKEIILRERQNMLLTLCSLIGVCNTNFKYDIILKLYQPLILEPENERINRIKKIKELEHANKFKKLKKLTEILNARQKLEN